MQRGTVRDSSYGRVRRTVVFAHHTFLLVYRVHTGAWHDITGLTGWSGEF